MRGMINTFNAGKLAKIANLMIESILICEDLNVIDLLDIWQNRFLK